MRRLVARALLAGMSALAATAAGAASPPIVRFATLSVDDGLPQSSVLSIVQDAWGFVWLGTQEGLSRYDGYRFWTLRAGPASEFLSDDEITDLVVDAEGGLWAGTGGGVHHVDTGSGKVTRIAAPDGSGGEVAVLAETAGRIWFAPLRGGLWVVEGDGAPGEREVRRVRDPLLPPDVPVDALAVAGSGLWAASGGKLLELSPGSSRAVRLHRRDLGSVSALAAGEDGGVWVGRADGGALARFDPPTGRLDLFPQVPRNVLALLPDGPGAVWVGARAGGLSRLDATSGEVVTRRSDPSDPASLSEDDVAELFRDRSGRLWVGTWNGGVSRLDPHSQNLRTLVHRPQVRDSVISDVIAMAETPDGRLWAASRNEALAVGDPESGRFRTVERGPAARITRLVHADGLLYAATASGLLALEAVGGDPRPLPAALARRGLASAGIGGLAASEDGALWIVSGASLFEKRRGDATVREWALPLDAPVSALFATSRQVWIGSESGELAHLERSEAGEGAIRSLVLERPSDLGGPAPWITALFADAATLWVGTRAGLGRIDLASGRQRWLGRDDGLVSSRVTGLLVDRAGRAWVATNRGLTRIDAGGAVLHLGTREGAQSSGYALGAFARGASGRFYFAGAGITVFDPERVTVDERPPEPILTELEISHERVRPRWLDPGSPLATQVHAARAVTLAPDDDAIAVEFAGLHFADPASHRYAYRLDDFDPEWIETDASRRVATYTDLPPGDYRLRVRAATKHSAWSAREAALAIRVLPYWWQTRWATWGAVLLAALLGVGVVQLRVWGLERDRKRLERVVAQRTAELEASNREKRQAEVSAALHSLVSGIAHEVRNPLFAISASVDALCLRTPDPNSARLHETLHRQVARLKALTGELLQYGAAPEPRLEQLRLEDLVSEAWGRCRTLAADREVELVTRFEGGVPPVEADRPSLVRSIESLLRNAIGFAPRGTAVVVSGVRDGGEVVLRVEDSGPGIAPGDEQRIFAPFYTTRMGASGLGLALARRFVESHGGRLTAESREGGGARFTLRLPV